MFRCIKNILWILLLAGSAACGQDPYYYSIDESKGLPSNSVYDIFQDKTGYMWFATNDGLCRYNGTAFKSYSSEEQTSKAGSGIDEDRYGRIWYSNFDGYLYYVANGRLNSLKQDKPTGYLKYALTNNYLYVSSKDGVDVYLLKDLKFSHKIYIADDKISYAYNFGEKYYVVGEYLYEITAGKLTRKIGMPKNLDVQGLLVQYTPEGMLFMSKYVKNAFLFKNNAFIEVFDIGVAYIQNLATDKNGVWMCTPKGVYLWDMTKGAYGKRKHYFSGHNISFVYKDKDKNYWISTLNEGVLLVQDFANVLYNLPTKPTVLFPSHQALTIATATGTLYQFDLTTNALTKKHEDGSNHAINQLYVDALSGYTIYTSNKFSFLGTKGKLVKQFLTSVKNVKRIDHKYFSYAATGSAGFFTLNHKEKSIWDSVYYQHKEIGRFQEAVLFTGLKAKSTAYNPINRTIYYATNLGLFYKELNNSGELKWQNGSLYLKTLIYGNKKMFALATNGKIYVIDSENKITLIALSYENKGKTVHKISILDDNLLVYTRSSIEAYSLSTGKWSSFLKLGLDLEVYDCTSYHNKLILATSKGLLLQDKKYITAQSYPKLIIDEVMVNDSVWNNNAIQKLKYDQNNIVINYSQLAYAPNKRYPVYYSVNNGKWQLLDASADALRLMSLSPGNYKIGFKLANMPDNYQPASVTFEISEPFWLSNFFIFAVGCIFLGFVYLFYQYKIAQNNKRNQQQLDRVNLEKNLNQSKLKAIKSQMNPHFFYNALNTIQSYILANDKKQAVGYLSKFSILTRTILDMSESEYVSIADELRMMRSYLDIEKARFDNDFDYEILLRGFTEEEDVKIPSMLLQPYLENAIKHGLLHKEGEKQLSVTFQKENGTLQVMIDDNGIGREKSLQLNQIKNKQHQSFATAAINNRVALLNQNNERKITVQYIDKKSVGGYATGTTVVIEIPTPSP